MFSANEDVTLLDETTLILFQSITGLPRLRERNFLKICRRERSLWDLITTLFNHDQRAAAQVF